MVTDRESFIQSLERNILTEMPSIKDKEVQAILTERDDKGWNFADEVVAEGSIQALLNLYHLLDKLDASLFKIIVQNRTKKGKNLLMLVAAYHEKDLEALFGLLKLVLEKVPDAFEDMVTAKAEDQWHMGHIIAEYQDSKTLLKFLNLVRQKASDAFEELVTAQTKYQWHMGHLIAQHQDSKTLLKFLKLVLEYAPGVFEDIMMARNNESTVLCRYIKSLDNNFMGQFVFIYLTSNIRLSDTMVNRYGPYKTNVLDYIKTLEANARLEVLGNCLDKQTALGRFLAIKQDIIHTHFFKNKCYVAIKTLQIETEQELQQAGHGSYSQNKSANFFTKMPLNLSKKHGNFRLLPPSPGDSNTKDKPF